MSHCPSCGAHVRTHGDWGHILGCGAVYEEPQELPRTGWEEGRWNVYETKDVKWVLKVAIDKYEDFMKKNPGAEKAAVFATELQKAILKLQA